LIAKEKQQKEETKNFLTVLNAKEKDISTILNAKETTNEIYTSLKAKKLLLVLKCLKREIIILSDPYSKSLKNF
jgi:hypothetical protein